MATLREELHTLVDQLPDEDVEKWLTEMQQSLRLSRANADWWASVEQIEKEIWPELGEMPSLDDVLNELREEAS